MRISDWSSDVCSSDLVDPCQYVRYFTFYPRLMRERQTSAPLGCPNGPCELLVIKRWIDSAFALDDHHPGKPARWRVCRQQQPVQTGQRCKGWSECSGVAQRHSRSKERRVGKECVSTGRSRWA